MTRVRDMEPDSKPPIERLIEIMARLRAPDGCPWDREQTHESLKHHAVEEAYELMDAIEADDNREMAEELGDVLLQVVFHCQLAAERGAFDFDAVCRGVAEKLVRRHPHVFGDSDAKDVDAVWAQWERIKREEKRGTPHERPSALDGIPRHLPALMRGETLVKKARRAGLMDDGNASPATKDDAPDTRLGERLLALVAEAQSAGLSAEAALRD